MESNNITEIENFLATSHPQNPKTKLLRKRLIELKNKAWTEVEDWKPMAARVENVTDSNVATQINSESDISTSIGLKLDTEENEFNTLNTKTPEEHKVQTVRLLNNMFDKDINSNEAILLIKNSSDCNIIMRINGAKQYTLPIKSKEENTILVDKGTYFFTSNVCNAKYNSQKTISKDLIIGINNGTIIEKTTFAKKQIKSSKISTKKKKRK